MTKGANHTPTSNDKGQPLEAPEIQNPLLTPEQEKAAQEFFTRLEEQRLRQSLSGNPALAAAKPTSSVPLARPSERIPPFASLQQAPAHLRNRFIPSPNSPGTTASTAVSVPVPPVPAASKEEEAIIDARITATRLTAKYEYDVPKQAAIEALGRLLGVNSASTGATANNTTVTFAAEVPDEKSTAVTESTAVIEKTPMSKAGSTYSAAALFLQNMGYSSSPTILETQDGNYVIQYLPTPPRESRVQGTQAKKLLELISHTDHKATIAAYTPVILPLPPGEDQIGAAINLYASTLYSRGIGREVVDPNDLVQKREIMGYFAPLKDGLARFISTHRTLAESFISLQHTERNSPAGVLALIPEHVALKDKALMELRAFDKLTDCTVTDPIDSARVASAIMALTNRGKDNGKMGFHQDIVNIALQSTAQLGQIARMLPTLTKPTQNIAKLSQRPGGVQLVPRTPMIDTLLGEEFINLSEDITVRDETGKYLETVPSVRRPEFVAMASKRACEYFLEALRLDAILMTAQAAHQRVYGAGNPKETIGLTGYNKADLSTFVMRFAQKEFDRSNGEGNASEVIDFVKTYRSYMDALGYPLKKYDEALSLVDQAVEVAGDITIQNYAAARDKTAAALKTAATLMQKPLDKEIHLEVREATYQVREQAMIANGQWLRTHGSDEIPALKPTQVHELQENSRSHAIALCGLLGEMTRECRDGTQSGLSEDLRHKLSVYMKKVDSSTLASLAFTLTSLPHETRTDVSLASRHSNGKNGHKGKQPEQQDIYLPAGTTLSEPGPARLLSKNLPKVPDSAIITADTLKAIGQLIEFCEFTGRETLIYDRMANKSLSLSKLRMLHTQFYDTVQQRKEAFEEQVLTTATQFAIEQQKADTVFDDINRALQQEDVWFQQAQQAAQARLDAAKKDYGLTPKEPSAGNGDHSADDDRKEPSAPQKSVVKPKPWYQHLYEQAGTTQNLDAKRDLYRQAANEALDKGNAFYAVASLVEIAGSHRTEAQSYITETADKSFYKRVQAVLHLGIPKVDKQRRDTDLPQQMYMNTTLYAPEIQKSLKGLLADPKQATAVSNYLVRSTNPNDSANWRRPDEKYHDIAKNFGGWNLPRSRDLQTAKACCDAANTVHREIQDILDDAKTALPENPSPDDKLKYLETENLALLSDNARLSFWQNTYQSFEARLKLLQDSRKQKQKDGGHSTFRTGTISIKALMRFDHENAQQCIEQEQRSAGKKHNPARAYSAFRTEEAALQAPAAQQEPAKKQAQSVLALPPAAVAAAVATKPNGNHPKPVEVVVPAPTVEQNGNHPKPTEAAKAPVVPAKPAEPVMAQAPTVAKETTEQKKAAAAPEPAWRTIVAASNGSKPAVLAPKQPAPLRVVNGHKPAPEAPNALAPKVPENAPATKKVSWSDVAKTSREKTNGTGTAVTKHL